jgi:hypothetical protein
MPSLKSFEKLPQFRKSVESIYKELGNSYNKHATITNLIRHMPKHERHFGKDIVEIFIKLGLLRKHRTDTFCWTEAGIMYCRKIITQEESNKSSETTIASEKSLGKIWNLKEEDKRWKNL